MYATVFGRYDVGVLGVCLVLRIEFRLSEMTLGVLVLQMCDIVL